MNWDETFIFRHLLLLFSWTASPMFCADTACFVHPKDVVVAAGRTPSLNCSASQGLFISSWQNGADLSTKIVVYTAPVYRRDGSIKTERFVANGYYVDEPKNNQAILHINSTSLSQAGTYYCMCSDEELSTASGAVVVIEPKFFQENVEICSEDPATFTCSLSSSESVSYALVIKNASGNTVATLNNSSWCGNGQKFCQLNYTIPANTSFFNQSFSCTVNVTTNKNLHFSEVLNSPVVYSNDCSGTGVSAKSTGGQGNNWITTLVVCCVVLILLTLIATSIVCLFKNRRRLEYKIRC